MFHLKIDFYFVPQDLICLIVPFLLKRLTPIRCPTVTLAYTLTTVHIFMSKGDRRLLLKWDRASNRL